MSVGLFIRIMECECLYCRSKKAGREFKEFANTWVRDNIQYAKPKGNFTKVNEIPERWEKYRVSDKNQQFEEQSHLPYERRYDEWTQRDHDRLSMTEYANERECVDLATRHSSPRDDGRVASSSKPTGYKVRVFREHETATMWLPKTDTKPPIPSGGFSSWQMSPKTRRRVTNAGKWMTAKYSYCSFITLTYDRPLCDNAAKQDLDRFLKRLRRCEYWEQPTKGSPGTGFLWVAERTRAHYLHFHIIVSNFVCMDWVQEAWRGSTGLKLYTNTKGATKYTAPYIVKYAAKNDRAYIVGRRWGQSQSVANGAKVLGCKRDEMKWSEFESEAGSRDFDSDEVYIKNGYLSPVNVPQATRKWYTKNG